MLRYVLDKYIPPSNLSAAIGKHMRILKGQRCPLNKQQKALLFPNGQPATALSSKGFDVSLLYTLLRNICNFKPHSKGWGHNPAAGDKSLSACIETIRISKNELNSNSITGEISDLDFKDIWKNLRCTIEEIELNELSGTSFVQYVDNLFLANLDPEKSSAFVAEINRMMMEECEIKDMLLDMKGIELKFICIHFEGVFHMCV